MYKFVFTLITAIMFTSSIAGAGMLLDLRAGPCDEEWKEGVWYVKENLSTFSPLNPDLPPGRVEFENTDERFCVLDHDDEQNYITGAWLAWSDGTNKGWLFPAEEWMDTHNKVEFITMQEFYSKWVWKGI